MGARAGAAGCGRRLLGDVGAAAGRGCLHGCRQPGDQDPTSPARVALPLGADHCRG